MIGMSRRRPRPSSEISTVVAREIIEMISAVFSGTRMVPPSPVLPRAMFTPAGASTRPMTMITGPVTMGGSRRMMMPVPRQRMTKLSTTYTAPATTMPPSVAGSPHVCTP